MKRTPLYERHKALGAKMVEFSGWEMPVQYSGIIEEHQTTRKAAGLFDISHMGRFFVSGPHAEQFLQRINTYDVAAIPEGQSAYGLMCYENGGIVDDIFVYHLAPQRYMVVVNAGNVEKDWGWFQIHAAGLRVELQNRSAELAMLALQGPRAEQILQPLTEARLAELPYHGVVEASVSGARGFISRTGYTGEDGFELFLPAGEIGQVWDSLLEAGKPAGLQPIGLGARDSLRFEAGLALYGHEIDQSINPFEARLGWVVKLEKGTFIGSEALREIKEQGPQRKLFGLEMLGRGIARQGYPVMSSYGQIIGTVVSGMPSPTLGKNLALALLDSNLASLGDELDVIIRDKPVRASVVKMPFYKPRYKK